MLASKNHPNLLHDDNTLVAIVDMQEPFLRTIFERERVITNVSALIQGAMVLRVPLVATTQYAERMGGVIPEIQRLLPPLRSAIDKMTFSSYATPSFASEVQRSGRKQILLCGVEAHICVCQTALEMTAAGFQVHVAIDAVSSRSEANWKLGIDKMRQGGVLITSVESALYEMLHEAGTPEFRDILKIIK